MKKAILLILIGGLFVTACRKGFLDTKPNKALLIPTTLSDMQALLDNNTVFNNTPGITETADGDFFSTDAGWKAWGSDAERNSYTWSQDIWGSLSNPDWNRLFQQIFYANVVLDGLKDLNPSGDYNQVKGTALFSRAFAYYHLLQVFAPQYNPTTAATDLGLPIRLVSDVNLNPPRASVAETYARVLSDLRDARSLLPQTTAYKNRPVIATVYAMLAKVYLAQGDYMRSGLYADSCLKQRGALLDYNTINGAVTRPFPRSVPNGNDEVIYYSAVTSYTFMSSTLTSVDNALYNSYNDNDLRKTLFFRLTVTAWNFRGTYSGLTSIFSGIASDEMYLIRAECSARQGDVTAAMTDLNTLLVKRWKTGTFTPLTAASADAALSLVLTERRKELVGRTIRWSDLRRLNSDTRFAVILNRMVNGQQYTLSPGSKRYTYPIPPDEIAASRIIQNER